VDGGLLGKFGLWVRMIVRGWGGPRPLKGSTLEGINNQLFMALKISGEIECQVVFDALFEL
jgi:hypothetical protein